MSTDVIYISDNVKRTYRDLRNSGSLRRGSFTDLSGMFWTGETVRVVSVANLPEWVYSMKYRRVVWDTEKQPELRLMSLVESRLGL